MPVGKGAVLGQLRVWPFPFTAIAAAVNGAETRAAISQDGLYTVQKSKRVSAKAHDCMQMVSKGRHYQYTGYRLFGIALLNAIATATRIRAPVATGIMNPAREPASVTAVDARNAVAPAGGCVSLRICIAKIETATEIAINTYFSPPAK